MDGALATTDPLTEFVDDLPQDKRNITPHQLLTHTAGFIDQLGDDYDALAREEMLNAVAESQLRSTPGTEHHYSNAGYSVPAAVIEKVSDTGYEGHLATHLFAPAGMDHTGCVLPEGTAHRSPWSTTRWGPWRAGPMSTVGTGTALTGTCVATEGCSPPRRTCSAGAWGSKETTSCPRKPNGSCSPAMYRRRKAAPTTGTAG